MFEGKELRTAKKSAAQKHELYVEMRQMYVALSKAYVKIRKKVDALLSACPEDRLMEEYIKLYLNRDSVPVPYSMPVLLGSSHILTLQDPWTDPVCKTNADITVGIYIDNQPEYILNVEDHHFSSYGGDRYYSVDAVQNQVQWDEILDAYRSRIESLRTQLKQINPLRVLLRQSLVEQLKEAKEQYKEQKEKAAYWFQNGLTAGDVGSTLFSQYGLRRKKCAMDFSSKNHKMEVDAMPIKRPRQLSETEETTYWKTYEAELDREIQKIRNYIPAEDDVYLDYEACANGISRSQVLEQCHDDVALYRFWLSASSVVYFKELVGEQAAFRREQAEYRQDKSRFIANLVSFGEYQVEDGYVIGTAPDSMAEIMSNRYGSIERRRSKAFQSDVKEINEKWERFALE